MHRQGARNVLIKGGHLSILDFGFGIADLSEPSAVAGGFSEDRKARDFLFCGDDLHVFEAEFIETTATHGTGCTLAAAIAANLAKGKSLFEAVEVSKRFVTEAIRTAPNLGHGHSPINHFAAS